MHRIHLESKTLAWVSYSPARLVLELGFRNGEVYAYFDVPQVTCDELLSADSKGRYFNHHIRNVFPTQRLPLTPPGLEN